MKPEELKFFNPLAETKFTLNRLPHWNQSGASYFITFRLADSVPVNLRERWNRERDTWLSLHPKPWTLKEEEEYHQQFSARMDRWLDAGYGACIFKDPACRQRLEKVLRCYDGDRYVHHAWVAMPNHAHILTSLKEGALIEDFVKPWKGTSARNINRHLGRKGTLWQEDYFDRLIRDGNHFARCVRYIANNPAKARLRSGEYTHFESELAALFARRR